MLEAQWANILCGLLWINCNNDKKTKKQKNKTKQNKTKKMKRP